MNAAIRGIALLLATALLMLAGCASPGGRDYPGGGYGYPDPGYGSPYGSPLLGTVDELDPGYGRILLLVDDPRTGRAQRMDVRYDQGTRLYYQGREYAVEGLERGDLIRVDVVESGRDLLARSIEVVRNVRDGGYDGGYSGGYGSGYGSGYGDGGDLRGSVGRVDARTRMIRLEGVGRGYGDGMQLAYDERTTVEYDGRRYRPEDLQRGDVVRVRARQVGDGLWLAERIIVERSVR